MFRALFVLILIPSLLQAQLPLAAHPSEVAAVEVAVVHRAEPTPPPARNAADAAGDEGSGSLSAAVTLLLVGTILVGGSMATRRWRRPTRNSVAAPSTLDSSTLGPVTPGAAAQRRAPSRAF